MAANLRRGNLPTETTMARFMYYIIKQLDVRGVDWGQVADNMDITNGHAARMRYARYKNQVEGVQPRPREPRSANASPKNSRGRPSAKKRKVEQGKKEEDEEGFKKDPDAPAGNKDGKRKIKGEGGEDGTREAKMAGGLGPGAGIKREFDDVDAEGDVDETAENHMHLVWTASTSERSPSKTGSKPEMAAGIKREPVDGESGSLRRNSTFVSTTDGNSNVPGELTKPTELSKTSQAAAPSGTSEKDHPSSPRASNNTSPRLYIPSSAEHQTVSPTTTFSQTANPNMHHFQLSQPPSSQRLFSNDMTMQQTQTPPPPPSNLLSSTGGQGFTYPVPSYHTYAGQSPATTSSAPYSLPPSPVGGYQSEMNGYSMGGGGGGGGRGYDINAGLHSGVSGGMMMNQGSFLGMLQDPSFPNTYGDAVGGYGVGGWQGMYQ